jgi:hypothetical protein
VVSAACRLCGGRPDAEVVASWTLVIDRDAPSQNRLPAKGRGGSSFAYAKERDLWVMLFMVAARSAGVSKVAGPRRVTFTRRYAGRKKLRDHANVIGGMNPVVDAMVRAGLLVDDSPAWFEAYYRQERVGHGGGTIVLLEELAP